MHIYNIYGIWKAYAMAIGHSGLSKYSFYKFTVLCLFSRLFKQINNRQLNVHNTFFGQFIHLNTEYRIWWMLKRWMMLFYALTDTFKVYLIQSVRHLKSKWKWYSIIDIICKWYLLTAPWIHSLIRTGDVQCTVYSQSYL